MKEFVNKLIDDVKDIDPEFVDLVNDNFYDLIDNKE